MASFARAALAVAITLSAACAHEPSVDVASPNARLAGARLYVVHEAGYRSEAQGARPETSTLYFATSAASGVAIESCTRDQACYAALDTASLAATIAADGHAAAISLDDGATWRNVALDGRAPFLCRHHTARSPAELWSKVPSTRALVIELLRDPAAHADATKTHWKAATTNFQAELAAAIAYATIANDEPLWIEVARGFGTPTPLLDLTGDERTALASTLRPIARERPSVRALLVAAMASTDANVRRRVAEVLAFSGAEDAQDALADALIADDVPDDGKATLGAPAKRTACWTRATEAWALASTTHERHAGSPRVRESLRQATRPRFVCPPGDDGVGERIAFISVVRGLASLRDEETLRALASGANGTVACWPKTFERLDECANDASFGVDVWANTALAHLGE